MHGQKGAVPSRRIGAGRDNEREEREWLLTPRQVAALFHINPKTVARRAQTGKIDFITTPGGHRRYRRNEIHSLVSALSVPVLACSDVDAVNETR